MCFLAGSITEDGLCNLLRAAVPGSWLFTKIETWSQLNTSAAKECETS